MPVTRRSTRASASAGPQQSTLSFKNKVTKSVPTSAKDKVHRAPAPARVKEILPSPEPEEHQQPEIEVKQEKTEAEVRAANVTDAAISNYWKQIEDSRMAKEVHKKHTAGLSTGEKVLRYFDVSSQYGPCIGITRLKRWQRAERLGLRPPIEALAVLLNEEAKGVEGIERAHMDELLSSTALGSA